MNEQIPPEIPSDEADRTQLELAKREGDAYRQSLDYMVGKVADNGAVKNAGDYIVAIAQERAEGMYRLGDSGDLEWDEPADHNCHLEVSVSDRGDGRFIPYLDIEATFVDEKQNKVGPFKVPFLWHPGLYHYGRNIAVPRDGHYEIRLKIEPPQFMRHDRKNGRRYTETIELSFEKFEVTTGQE